MKRLLPILPWLGALMLIAFVLLCFESDLLWKVQQYNLFLDISLFFRDQMLVPGGFLSFVSCYFTQFFFHPWQGVLLLCGWWFLLMWLTKRTFRISDSWTVLALTPVAILLVANMNLGYWHYFMKLRGYFYVATIGTTAGVALLWTFRTLPQKLWLRCLFLMVTSAIGYPLFGIYALATVMLMAIWIWRLSQNRSQNAILTIIALLSIIAVPLFCYRYIYYQTNYDDIWTTALPTFLVQKSYPQYYIPYYLLGIFFLMMVVLYQKTLTIKSKTFFRWSPQMILAVVLIACVWYFWYKDDNFHHELTMQHRIENTDWEGVLLEDEEIEEPTHVIVMMHNLALMKLGRQLDEMYNYPKASVKSNTVLPLNMVYHVIGRMIYYHYGLLNDCHRICLEDGVEYGWRVELLEYMARCSLLCGETQAAQKALDLLRHTTFQDKWADAMQQLVDNPKQIADARETGLITHMMHYSNALGGDGGNVERYVMTQLASQDSDDPFFQQQAVVGALWMMNPQIFWKRINHYTRLLKKSDPMPRIFQEGAYLFGKMANMPNIEKYPFDKSVKKTYHAFMKEAKKYDNQPANIGRSALYPFYGNTYYYEYYFLKNLH